MKRKTSSVQLHQEPEEQMFQAEKGYPVGLSNLFSAFVKVANNCEKENLELLSYDYVSDKETELAKKGKVG